MPFFKAEMASIRTKPPEGNNRKGGGCGVCVQMIKIFKFGHISAKPNLPLLSITFFFFKEWFD